MPLFEVLHFHCVRLRTYLVLYTITLHNKFKHFIKTSLLDEIMQWFLGGGKVRDIPGFHPESSFFLILSSPAVTRSYITYTAGIAV